MELPTSIQLQQSTDVSGRIRLRTYSKDPWCPKNVQQFIDAWELTPEQIDNMWDLQRRLVDVDHWKNEPESVLRFMTAPAGFAAAEENFRKMIEWRLENNIDTILDDYRPPEELMVNTSAAMLHGFDKQGDPIYVERGGATDAAALLKNYGHDEFLKYAIWTRELHTRGAWIDYFEKTQGRRIFRVTVVYDLKGMSSKHMNRKVLDFFGDVMKVSHEYYPGPFKRIIIIRAPSIFNYVWAIAKHFFRQSARKKMIFAGKNYLNVLDEFIERDVLPPSIAPGGCGRVADGLPNLLGDDEASSRKTRTKLLDSRSSYMSDISLAGTDDGSTSSDEFFLGSSQVSVSGSALMKGHWKGRGGDSEIFTRSCAEEITNPFA